MNQALAIAAPADAPLLHVGPNDVHIKPGFNPRRRPINEASTDFLEFADSVAEHGVIEPIVIRPRPEGGYWLIAGERRLRAARLKQITAIPATVRDVDDETALVLAITENVQREDMTPIEEAEAAHKIMSDLDGNVDEVLRRLGWNRTKLDRRLLLIHAIPEVRDAFLADKIQLGHVELLATIPAESQSGTLKAIIEKGIAVGDFKSRIAAFARNLSTAIFETAGCQKCPHNSSTQIGLFAEHINEGRCANPECFGNKTHAALDAKKQALAGEYNVVFFDTEKLKTDYAVLIEDEVGAEQLSACKGCGNCGALMLTAPGQEGRIAPDVCFSVGCHATKIADHKNDLAAAAKATSSPKGTGKQTVVKGKRNVGNAKKAASKTVNTTPKAVIEQCDRFYREVAGGIANGDINMKMAIAAHALYKDASGFDLEPYIGQKRLTGRHDLIAAFYKLDQAASSKLITALAVYIAQHKKNDNWMDKDLVKTAERMVAITGTNLVGRFKLDEAFLKAHTKAGIEALMHEATNADGQTFVEWLNAKTEKGDDFKKLMGKKSDEIITGILASGFDFSAYVPSCINGRLKDHGINTNDKKE
ncbi:MAG: PRTRC system ParB family protein [FCB group bacterium]|jgi:PRTRC genetic system ParB family protein|nr:PRTRC system ParB family protein [FCB group bacterium]